MTDSLRPALAAGHRCLSEWAALLDRINVFPVADGDTGRNLVSSLAPLADPVPAAQPTVRAMLLSARGNSGNIATQLLSPLVALPTLDALPAAVARGREQSWCAVHDPQPGTLLTFCDAWAAALRTDPPPQRAEAAWVERLLHTLAEAVRATRAQQPLLARAGVVDAGALGLFVFTQGLLAALQPAVRDLPSVAERFGDGLQVDPDWEHAGESGFCLDAVVRLAGPADAQDSLSALGDSAVYFRAGDCCKVHVHAADLGAAREQLGRLGEIVQLTSDDLAAQGAAFAAEQRAAPVHLMTDAAGTLVPDDAARYGVTLLDSYIQLAAGPVAESRLPAQQLYAALRAGERVSTAQASTVERHACYAAALRRGERVIYLAVGAAFTGNYRVACAYRDAHGLRDRFRVIDSGAASGRLGVVALAVARLLGRVTAVETLVRFSEQALECAEEWIFLDRLTWLARGGRLSKTAAFFGDALRMKPVVTPRADGAQKVGVVRRASDQLPFLRERLDALGAGQSPGLVLLQHTDNEERLRTEIAPAITAWYPDAEILHRRMSLTSGAHMGPGTWALACLPQLRPAGPEEHAAGAAGGNAAGGGGATDQALEEAP